LRLITGAAVIYGLSWLMVVFTRNILLAIFLSGIGALILIMLAFSVDGIDEQNNQNLSQIAALKLEVEKLKNQLTELKDKQGNPET
jgi:cell division protein FtsB